MRFDPASLPEPVLAFLSERHLATLTTLGDDGMPHVVPVGFSYEPQARLARVITSGDSVKARNAARPGVHGALCQVDRGRWLTLQGELRVDATPEAVADAVARYAERYRQPRPNPNRVALLMTVSSMLGTVT